VRMSRSVLFRLVALVAVGAAGSFAACSTLQSVKSPKAAFAACTASALLPLAGTVERAEQAARELRAGQVDIDRLVDATKATAAEAETLRKALEACAKAYSDIAPGIVADAGVSDAG
jgi:hypothetical protein